MEQVQPDLDQSDVVLRNAKGGIVAAIPQFGLFARADSIQEALAALNVKKQALAADFAAFADIKPPQTSVDRHPVRWVEIRQFAIKAVIVFALLLATLLVLAIKTSDIVDSAIARIEVQLVPKVPMGGGAFWSQVERQLDHAADPTTDLTPETRQKLLADIRAIVARWRPFVAEIQPLFNAAAPESPPQAAPVAK